MAEKTIAVDSLTNSIRSSLRGLGVWFKEDELYPHVSVLCEALEKVLRERKEVTVMFDETKVLRERTTKQVTVMFNGVELQGTIDGWFLEVVADGGVSGCNSSGNKGVVTLSSPDQIPYGAVVVSGTRDESSRPGGGALTYWKHIELPLSSFFDKPATEDTGWKGKNLAGVEANPRQSAMTENFGKPDTEDAYWGQRLIDRLGGACDAAVIERAWLQYLEAEHWAKTHGNLEGPQETADNEAFTISCGCYWVLEDCQKMFGGWAPSRAMWNKLWKDDGQAYLSLSEVYVDDENLNETAEMDEDDGCGVDDKDVKGLWIVDDPNQERTVPHSMVVQVEGGHWSDAVVQAWAKARGNRPYPDLSLADALETPYPDLLLADALKTPRQPDTYSLKELSGKLLGGQVEYSIGEPHLTSMSEWSNYKHLDQAIDYATSNKAPSSYACRNQQCPQRAPSPAPSVCYTCGRTMELCK